MISARRAPGWLPGGAIGAALLVGVGVFVAPLLGLAMTGLAALGFVLLAPAAAAPLLIGASALSRIALTSGDAQIRIELVVTFLLVAAIAARLAVRTMSWRALASPLLLPLLTYFGLNLVSTLLFARERTRGLKLDAEILAVILTFVAIVAVVRSRRDLERALDVMWVVTTAEAAAGVLLLLMYVAHLSSYGVQLGDFGLPMSYGTSWEANIFGSFLLGNFLLLLGDYLRRPASLWRGLGLLVILAGIGASETRTVWLGLVLGILILGGLAARYRETSSRALPILLGAPVLALLALIVGSATPLAGRLLDVVNLHSSSASGRLVIFNAAVADWRRHPLLGSGTGSFNFGAAPGQPHPWLPNLTLLTLHDTGALGLASLLFIVAVFYVSTFRTMIRAGRDAPLLAGAMAGFAGLLVAFQTTSGFWFAYPWILAGLGMAAARLLRPAS